MDVRALTGRKVGWLMMLSGLPSLLLLVGPAREQLGSFAFWWNVWGWACCAVVLLLAGFGLVMSLSTLRAVWTLFTVSVFALQSLAFIAYEGVGDPPLPWPWMLEPVSVTLLVLLTPATVAVGLAIVSGSSIAIIALLTFGYIPADILALTPSHISNIGFVVIAIGIRARLTSLRNGEAAARVAAERAAHAHAAAVSRSELSLLVHDEVLSVFNAAPMFRGDPPQVLRDEARHALAVLQRSPVTDGVTILTPAEAARRLTAVAISASPDAVVAIRATDPAGALSPEIVDEIGRAMAEAVRNSVRHSRARTLTVTGSVTGTGVSLTVEDDGAGFNPAEADPDRFGLQQSIIGRMERIAGTGRIRSRPGEGTEVVLRWSN